MLLFSDRTEILPCRSPAAGGPAGSFSLMPVGPLLAVFGFLPCRAAAVRPGDILLLLGFGLYLAVTVRILPLGAERHSASGYYVVYVHDIAVVL